MSTFYIYVYCNSCSIVAFTLNGNAYTHVWNKNIELLTGDLDVTLTSDFCSVMR